MEPNAIPRELNTWAAALAQTYDGDKGEHGDQFKGIYKLFFPFWLFAALPRSRQKDRYNSFDCACSNKEETK